MGHIMLTEEQRQKYEQALDMAREEMESLDREMVAEVARAREALRNLQEAKKAVRLIYDGACARLGVQGDIKSQNVDFADLVKHA